MLVKLTSVWSKWISWENGNFYSGGWKKGKRHGKGFFMWANGRVYNGGWKNGKRQGEGDEYFNIREKLKYVGKFKDNERCGTGILYDQDGEKQYEGENSRMIIFTVTESFF
jgi:hypothetical protein